MQEQMFMKQLNYTNPEQERPLLSDTRTTSFTYQQTPVTANAPVEDDGYLREPATIQKEKSKSNNTLAENRNTLNNQFHTAPMNPSQKFQAPQN